MSTTTKKTIEDLNLANLQRRFFVGERTDDVDGKLVTKKVNLLQYALADGSFMELVQQCANEMHEGDIKPVFMALKRNIQSKESHIRKQKTDGAYAPRANYEAQFCSMLTEFIDKQMNALPEKRNDPMFNVTKGLARWKLQMADIEKIDKTDVAAFESIFNNMATAKSRMAAQIIEHYWTEVKQDPKGIAADMALLNDDRKNEAEALKDFELRYKYVSKLKSAAEKSLQNPKVQLSDKLTEKLAKGSKITLSSDEANELAELLKRLQK